MSWQRHFTHVPKNNRLEASLKKSREMTSYDGVAGGLGSKYSSYLPEVYAGQPNRVERYTQYDNMDQDSIINVGLNIIADFCTQTEEQNPLPFDIEWFEEASETEIDVLWTALNAWVRSNNFMSGCWEIFRQTIKFGDQFFIRDPETFKWLWIDPANITKIYYNENKEPLAYVIKNLDLNLQNKTMSAPVMHSTINAFTQGTGNSSNSGTKPFGGGSTQQAWTQGAVGTSLQGQQNIGSEFEVDARHVIHVSLSNGMDNSWPFGTSILESIYKTYKQKELLEDSIIIYRVQRAPERRVFYIDVGNTPPSKAMAYIERVKNEIHQKRIPSRTGGSASSMDAAYNPTSMLEDYFFAQSAEGRGSKVETLPGGESVGQIDDLQYFNNKLKDGMSIPSSYFSGSTEETGGAYNDGKVGTAYIQEFRFSKYCERLQRMLIRKFDEEFKRYIENSGLAIDPTIFSINFNPPQNFSKYRQIELDNTQLDVFSKVADIEFFSKRYIMRRFLGMSEDEIIENERLWAEEHAEEVQENTGINPLSSVQSKTGLSSVGIKPGSDFDGPLGDNIDELQNNDDNESDDEDMDF